MDKKKIYIVVMIVLALGWAITIGCLVKAKNELRDIKNGTSVITSQKDAFEVCEDTTNPDSQAACVEQLIEFSSLLKKYETKLRELNIEG